MYHKLKNHPASDHHHQNSSLQTFQTNVSNILTQFSIPEAEPETLSLSSVLDCLSLIPTVNKAFEDLVVGINYPMIKWKSFSVEEYFNYTFSSLHLLNLMASSIDHLNHASLSVSLALILAENDPSSLSHRPLEPIQPKKIPVEEFKDKSQNSEKEIEFSEKERIIYIGLIEVKKVVFWVCGVVLSALSGDYSPYVEIKKLAGGFSCSLSTDLDSRFCDMMMMERSLVVKQMKELNDAVGCMEEQPEELQKKLNEFEKLTRELRKEVDVIFSEMLGGRNKLLDVIRFT